MIAKDSVAEAVRVSHCAHPNLDGKHKCVGKCTITNAGVELDCVICGDGAVLITEDRHYRKLELMLDKIGVDIRIIARRTVDDMLDIMRQP